MERDRPEEESHAKTQRRKGKVSVRLRLCAGFLSNAAFVLCLALCVRCGALWLTPNAVMNDPDDYLRLATNLADCKTFGSGHTPTAYRPPLYPMVLSGCVLLGDYDRAVVVLAITLLHIVLGVATVGLVLLLGRWWGLGAGGAAVAALLVACDPILLASSSLVMTETLATLLATAGLLALTWAGRRRTTSPIAGNQRLAECGNMRDNDPRAVGPRLFSRYIIVGAVLALAALCRPAFLLWMLAAGVVLLWQAFTRRSIANDNSRGPAPRGKIANSLRAPAAFALGSLMVLSPWAIRNQLQFGRPIITTTHGGYTLFLANNPEFYEWLRHGSWGSVWQADEFNYNWDLRRPSDELQADRQAYAEAWQTIRAQPGMFLYACVVWVGRFWSPLPHRVTATETPWAVRHLIELDLRARFGQLSLPHRVTAEEPPFRRLSRYAVALWYMAEFLLAIVGIWRVSHWALKCPARASSGWHWGLLLIVCLMAGHVVYWTDMRMRAPIMPVVAIIAAAGLCGRRPRDD